MVECGDIVKTPFGVMIVESIKKDGTLIGHQLTKMVQFWGKDVKILNSDFRYRR